MDQVLGEANVGTTLNLVSIFPAVPRSSASEALSHPCHPPFWVSGALPSPQQAYKPQGTLLLWLLSHSLHSCRLLPPTTTFMELSHVQKHD